LGICLAAFGAQNTAHANIESRSAAARSFRCPGRVKNDGAVIKLGLAWRSAYPCHSRESGNPFHLVILSAAKNLKNIFRIFAAEEKRAEEKNLRKERRATLFMQAQKNLSPFLI
jgi:hypothetical protein